MMSDVYNLEHTICGSCGRYICECRENRAAAEWYEFEPIPVDEIRRGGGEQPRRGVAGTPQALVAGQPDGSAVPIAPRNPARLVESRPLEILAGVPRDSGRVLVDDARPVLIDRAPGNVASGELVESGRTRVLPGSYEHEPVYGGERTVFSAYAVCLSAVVGAAICVCVWFGLLG